RLDLPRAARRGAGHAQGVHVHRLRDRAPGGPGPPGDPGAFAGPGRLRALGGRLLAAGVARPDPAPAGLRDPAGAHRALAVARRRPGDLGQPGHTALRDLRLRPRAPARRAGDRGRPGPGRRRRPPERPGQGRGHRLLPERGMSASSDTATQARGRVPVYKRRRRRIYAGAAVAAAVVIALIVWAVTQGSGGSAAALPSFTIAYGQGTVANSDSILASDGALAKTIPAHLHFVPFDAGVTAIAEMRSGSLQAIRGVGNPPVVGAIGTHTGVDVVIAQSFDADALIVP